MTWMRCPSRRSVTLRRASSAPICRRCSARSAMPLMSTCAVDLDHRAAGQGAGAWPPRRGGRRPGRARAAHAQIAEVLGVQVGRHGLDQFAVDEDVDGVLVGPHVRELPGAPGAHPDPLHRGDDREQAAGGDDGVELDRTGRRQQHQPAVAPPAVRRDRVGRVLVTRSIWRRGEHQGSGWAWAGTGWPGSPCPAPGAAGRGCRRAPRRLIAACAEGRSANGPAAIEQFAAQGLVPPLHLPGGGRRVRLGEPGGDAVLPADPLEQHLGRAGLGEPAGELLAVVGQHLCRAPRSAASPR